jgi:hypothetical protein
MANVISLEMVLYSLESSHVFVQYQLILTHTRNKLFCAANEQLYTTPLFAPRTQLGRTDLKIRTQMGC